jgi:ATP-dependent RNA helicase DeaD
MTQDQRERVMKRTRGGAVDLLVATDVAARGIDIEQISHVINFNVPESPAAYVHRIGRTGRAGREGVAITFAEPREHRMLKNIEQLTDRRIDMARLPTVMDVRAKQLEVTRASLREALQEGDLDGYRVIVESLASEFDVMEIATAAVKLAHLASASAIPEGAAELPDPTVRDPRKGKRERPTGGRKDAPGMTRIYVGAGRKQKMRPGDLVGAIANEAHLTAAQIGAIQISETYSLVELPDDLVDRVIAALRATTIKGKRQTVRRDLVKGR